MSDKTLTLFCTVRPTKGKEDALRDVLLNLCAKSAEVEFHCVRYELYEKIEERGGEKRIVFHFLEKWMSKDHLDEHEARDWMTGTRKKLEDEGLLEEDEIGEELKMIGGFTVRT